MAAESRVPDTDLSGSAAAAALEENPQSFGFFQAVRLLRRLAPEREAVGEFADPGREVVRFSSNPSLAFPAGEVQELEIGEDGPARMMVNFMGLVGHMGVLPLHYTRLVNDEQRDDDRPLTDFIDLFQHRIVSLFYQAWERSHFYVPFERGDEDRVTRHLLDLIGLGDETLRSRLQIPDVALLYYCGLLGMRQRSAVALEQMLEDYFGVPVEVLQFLGGWYSLSDESRCRVDDEPGFDAAGLGEGVVVGDEIWDSQARVRIRVGPVNRSRYEDFLPGQEAHNALRAITEFFGDGQFDFELQLVLAEEDVPGVVLDASAEDAPSLGWSTWIRTRPMSRDADETTLTL
jgi:type VI secretion system protein ImpH